MILSLKSKSAKSYQPVGTAIWLEYVDERMHSEIFVGKTTMPPFVEARVIAVGIECKEVKEGDTVVVNSVAMTAVKDGADTVYFTKEQQVVAIVR